MRISCGMQDSGAPGGRFRVAASPAVEVAPLRRSVPIIAGRQDAALAGPAGDACQRVLLTLRGSSTTALSRTVATWEALSLLEYLELSRAVVQLKAPQLGSLVDLVYEFERG